MTGHSEASATVVIDDRELAVPEAEVSGDALWLSAEAAESLTGWALTAAGFCASVPA